MKDNPSFEELSYWKNKSFFRLRILQSVDWENVEFTYVQVFREHGVPRQCICCL